MKEFPLKIASPEGLLFDGNAVQLSVRGISGELAILAGHIPFVTALKESECRIYIGNDGKEIRRAHVTGGMLIVTKDCVRMLSSGFTWEEDNKKQI